MGILLGVSVRVPARVRILHRREACPVAAIAAAPSCAAAFGLRDNALDASVDLYVLVALRKYRVRRAVYLDIVVAGEVRLSLRLRRVLVGVRGINALPESLETAAQALRIARSRAVIIPYMSVRLRFRLRFRLVVIGVCRIVRLYAVQTAGKLGLSKRFIDYLPGAGKRLALRRLFRVKV